MGPMCKQLRKTTFEAFNTINMKKRPTPHSCKLLTRPQRAEAAAAMNTIRSPISGAACSLTPLRARSAINDASFFRGVAYSAPTRHFTRGGTIHLNED